MLPDEALDAKLCYIEDLEQVLECYFVKDIDAVIGDDWNDAPYEHNAEPPYDDSGNPVYSVFVKTGMCTPCRMAGRNSPYSVDMINAGAVAWLATTDTMPHHAIHAGTSLRDFIAMIIDNGGDVFVPIEWAESA